MSNIELNGLTRIERGNTITLIPAYYCVEFKASGLPSDISIGSGGWERVSDKVPAASRLEYTSDGTRTGLYRVAYYDNQDTLLVVYSGDSVRDTPLVVTAPEIAHFQSPDGILTFTAQ